MQWARSFIESGLVYVSYTKIRKFVNYKITLAKYQKFPLLKNLKTRMVSFFHTDILKNKYRRGMTKLGRRMFNMPLPITLAAYRVKVKGIVH
jgi:hypothetical protein